MATPVSWLMIEDGWDVSTPDGEVAARVTAVLGDEERDIFDGLAVKLHWIGHQHYLPAEHVRLIVPGRVEVGLDSDGLERLERYPRH